MTTLIRSDTTMEYFRGLVEAALAHQRVDAGELTACYVVNMLAGFTHVDGPQGQIDSEPLALGLARAIEQGGSAQRAAFRRVGDLSLFVSGFFSDSLKRKLVDLDYYIALGGFAYGALSRNDDDSFSPVFGELANKFVAFVDVLSEVSEQSAGASNIDLLRLYEKWLRTGSRRNGEKLVEHGIVPNRSVAGRFVQ